LFSSIFASNHKWIEGYSCAAIAQRKTAILHILVVYLSISQRKTAILEILVVNLSVSQRKNCNS
jgi:hypothetical protein